MYTLKVLSDKYYTLGGLRLDLNKWGLGEEDLEKIKNYSPTFFTDISLFLSVSIELYPFQVREDVTGGVLQQIFRASFYVYDPLPEAVEKALDSGRLALVSSDTSKLELTVNDTNKVSISLVITGAHPFTEDVIDYYRRYYTQKPKKLFLGIF